MMGQDSNGFSGDDLPSNDSTGGRGPSTSATLSIASAMTSPLLIAEGHDRSDDESDDCSDDQEKDQTAFGSRAAVAAAAWSCVSSLSFVRVILWVLNVSRRVYCPRALLSDGRPALEVA